LALRGQFQEEFFVINRHRQEITHNV
jgi:hypothetical protein